MISYCCGVSKGKPTQSLSKRSPVLSVSMTLPQSFSIRYKSKTSVTLWFNLLARNDPEVWLIEVLCGLFGVLGAYVLWV